MRIGGKTGDVGGLPPRRARKCAARKAVDLLLRGIAHQAQALQRQRNRERGKLSK